MKRPITRPAGGKFYDYRGFFLLSVFVLLVWMMFSFIKPVVMGAIFATILYPLLVRMGKWRTSINIKAGVLTLGFMVAFLIPVGFLIIVGAQGAIDKFQDIQAAANEVGASKFSFRGVVEILGLQSIMQTLGNLIPLTEEQFRQVIMKGLQLAGGYASALAQRLVADLPGLLLSTIVILFAIFFLLVDGRKATRFVRENSIFSPRQTDQLLETMQSLCFSTVVATIVAGVVQTLLLTIALFITGTSNIVLIALITLICSFLPVIGTLPVTAFLSLQALVLGEGSHAIIFGVFIFLIGISDNVVRPYILKGGANLHPLVGFVAAFGALETLGFYGLFIGPVVAGIFFHVLPLITRSYPQRSSSDV